MRRKLPTSAIKAIHAAVDVLFEKAKTRMLGPQSLDRRLGMLFSPTFSIPGLFTAAARDEYIKDPDAQILKTLMGHVGNYIDSYREATKARVTKAVDAWLQEAALKGVETDLETVLGGELAGVWGKVTGDMRRLIDTEASNARNTGALDGIIRVNAAHNIEDPVVYFVVVRDRHLCDECKRLHMLEDERTPRLWYLSEVGHGYHKKGQENPKLGGLHPSCRCSMVTLMQGYSFNSSGFVTFKGLGYNAIEEQRKTQKSEIQYEPHDCEELRKGSLQQRHPYNPAVDTSDEERYTISNWQNWADPADREKIPRLEGEGRFRALHKLSARTQVRGNPLTGEREFLLHRAGGAEDEKSSLLSWSADKDIAQGFARGKKTLISDWIPESRIHHVLDQVGYVNDAGTARMYGNTPKPGISVPHPTDSNSIPRAIGKPGYHEHEVIVSSEGKTQKSEIQYEPHDCEDLKKLESHWDTPEFKSWFDGSHAVNEDGKPLLLYHGSDTGGFNEFRTPAYLTPNPGEANMYAVGHLDDTHGNWRGRTVPFDPARHRIEDLQDAPSLNDLRDILSSKPGPGLWTDYKNLYEVGQDNKIALVTGKNTEYNPSKGGFRFVDVPPRSVSTIHPVYVSIKNPKYIDDYREGSHFCEPGSSHGGCSERHKIEEYKAQGYDGIITNSDWGSSKNYIPFYPHQIKSAIANEGTYSPENPDIAKSEDGPGTQLPLAVVDEYGQHLETGKPVIVKFVRNTQKAPDFGERYQQHIEPAGRYMLHNPAPGDLAEGWEQGEVSFKNPLVISSNTGQPGSRIYDENSWKAHLHRVFGKKGLALSRLLRARGYDGIVTVHDGSTREIVDLTGLVDGLARKSETGEPLELLGNDQTVPHEEVYDMGGTYAVADQSMEQVEAAKAAGYSHVPVRILKD